MCISSKQFVVPTTRRSKAARSGFTLVELLVVVAIIALLAAILFPVYASVRERAKQASCMSNMRQIGMALTMYLGDKGDKLPPYIQGEYGAIGSSLTASKHMEGPGIRIADYKSKPTTPAERFSLGDGGEPWTYYSWMDCLYKYTNSVEVFTCPSHSGRYPIDPTKLDPPYGGKPESWPSETYSSPTATEPRLRWFPSLAVNGVLMYGNFNGERNWGMSEINGPTGKIMFVHNAWTYQYQNPYDYHRIAITGTAGKSAQQGTFPHNDGSIIIFADGHAKSVTRLSVTKWTCATTPGALSTYNAGPGGNPCGYWNPTIAPPA